MLLCWTDILSFCVDALCICRSLTCQLLLQHISSDEYDPDDPGVTIQHTLRVLLDQGFDLKSTDNMVSSAAKPSQLVKVAVVCATSSCTAMLWCSRQITIITSVALSFLARQSIVLASIDVCAPPTPYNQKPKQRRAKTPGTKHISAFSATAYVQGQQ